MENLQFATDFACLSHFLQFMAKGARIFAVSRCFAELRSFWKI